MADEAGPASYRQALQPPPAASAIYAVPQLQCLDCATERRPKNRRYRSWLASGKLSAAQAILGGGRHRQFSECSRFFGYRGQRLQSTGGRGSGDDFGVAFAPNL